MPRLAAGEASFGLIFVDGDHQAEAVRHDVGWALRLLAPGGVLACHDYSEDCCCPGVRQALDELFPEGGELTNSLFVMRRRLPRGAWPAASGRRGCGCSGAGRRDADAWRPR